MIVRAWMHELNIQHKHGGAKIISAERLLSDISVKKYPQNLCIIRLNSFCVTRYLRSTSSPNSQCIPIHGAWKRKNRSIHPIPMQVKNKTDPIPIPMGRESVQGRWAISTTQSSEVSVHFRVHTTAGHYFFICPCL